MRYATPRKCPVPGCEHAPMTNPGGYLTHVMACRRKERERAAATAKFDRLAAELAERREEAK